jgi:hypothetical protein
LLVGPGEGGGEVEHAVGLQGRVGDHVFETAVDAPVEDVFAQGGGAALFVSHDDGEVAAIAQACGEVGVSILGATGAGGNHGEWSAGFALGVKTRSGVWAPSDRGEVRVCWANKFVGKSATKIAVRQTIFMQLASDTEQ